MKQPVDMPTELLITTLNANSELALLAAAWAGNYDSRKNGKRFKAEIDKITKRQQDVVNDILKRHAPELLNTVDRFEVIDESGRAYVKGSIYGTPVSVDLSYQDDGKTLKVFVKERQ